MSFIEPIKFNTKSYTSVKKYTTKDGTIKDYTVNYSINVILSQNKQLNKNRKLLNDKIKDMNYNELKLVFDFINNMNSLENPPDNIKIE